MYRRERRTACVGRCGHCSLRQQRTGYPLTPSHSTTYVFTKLWGVAGEISQSSSNPFFPLLCKEFVSKPSFNPSEIELGCEVTLKVFPYVNYSRPRSRAEVGAHHLQMGSAPSVLCKSPSSGRCRFGLIKSYAEPVYLSLLRILGNFDFLAISELLVKGKLKTSLILVMFLALGPPGQLR